MKNVIDIETIVNELSKSGKDIKIRKLNAHGTKLYLFFISQLTDKARLSSEVIKPILKYEHKITSEILLSSVLFSEEVDTDNDANEIDKYIMSGRTVIMLEGENDYLVINLTKVEKRGVESPELETTLRGSKDAFTENLETNLSLIRYRIRDGALTIDKQLIGRRTRTNVAVLYIKGVANDKFVNQVMMRLSKIDIDGAIDSSYIQKFLAGGSKLFPQMGVVERSDIASDNLLQGKICILIDGNNLGIILPKVFLEFFDSGEDHYNPFHVSIFTKILRLTALFFALCLSSLYVSIIAFNTDILPTDYIMSIAMSRASVPFFAILEAILMEFTAEILKEASIRLPKQIGPAIGIVGTIVIGQAAVSAGLVSPLMVIVVSLGMMCSFVAPDYIIMSPIRILKFAILVLTGIFGMFGFIIAIIAIIVHLESIESFGVPYLSPVTPMHTKDLKDYFTSDIILDKSRPNFLKTKNRIRQK